MKIHIFDDVSKLEQRVADTILSQVKENPNAKLGLATGSTPLKMYELLVQAYEAGQADFSGVTTFNLDEYIGLNKDHPCSYHRYMWDNLFSKINVPTDRVHLPSGVAADPARECAEYEAAIEAAGGIDLQLLGLGQNGHVGFNEPGTPFGSRTQVVALAQSTIDANSRFFDRAEDVPREAVSMGIRTIMNAQRIVLMAMGEAKAEAVRALVEGPVTEDCPASVLQLHPNVELFLDEEAAKLLKK